MPWSAREQLTQMVTGCWVTQMLYVAAKLELADRLADRPRLVSELAQETGSHEASLYRLLRALASVGVFAEGADQHFQMTEMAEFLRTGHPQSLHAAVLMSGGTQQIWSELFHSIRTGQSGFEKVRGKPWFDYLGDNDAEASVFDQTMVSTYGGENAAIAISYDFNAFQEIVDVGGGIGSHLRGILRLHRQPKGVVFDLPHVVERTAEYLASHGMAERCRTVAGSFFETIPAGADAYILRHIIHDWDDEKSAVILDGIRRVIPPEGKLLVIESVIEPGNKPAFVKLLDLAMLVFLGGQERTELEYRKLFATSGFELTKVVPTPAGVHILEAVPV
jgi:hypothetical protein